VLLVAVVMVIVQFSKQNEKKLLIRVKKMP